MAATRILPIVWPTRTLYWSLDVTSRKTATEFCPRGSKATATSFRSVRRGLRSEVVRSDTNGSRLPSPSYAKISRLINTRGAVSATGIGAVAAAGFLALGGGGGALVVAALAALFAFGLGAAWASACAEAPVASAATKTSAKEIERFIIVSPTWAVHMASYERHRSAPGTRCR